MAEYQKQCNNSANASNQQKKIDKVLLIGSVGNTHEFIPGGEETWTIYIEHLEIYFRANNFRNHEQKKNILLTVMGKRNYGLLRKLCAPKKPEQLTYKEINQTLSDFYNPASLKYVKRHEFNNRLQKDGESFAAFVAELNGLSEHCEFENFEDAIIGQILSGMRDQGLKKHFIRQSRQSKLTLEEVKQKGITSDQAHNDALKMSAGKRNPNSFNENKRQHFAGQQSAPEVPVDLEMSTTPNYIQQCYRCGDWHLLHAVCPHINKTCNYCKKKGHLIQVCNKLRAKREREEEEEEEDDEFREHSDECCVIL